MHKIIRGCVGTLGFLVISFTLFAVLAVQDGYRFNPSSSAPVGIWKISQKKPEALIIGEYVLICPPRHDVLMKLVSEGRMFKGRCDSGTVPFIKEVIAQGSGSFRVDEEGVFINETLVPLTAPYPWENLLPAEPTVIGTGEFVAIQTMHVGSIDSRYFGPLKVSEVIGVIEPVWIF